jgi:single-stranded-DNA-specific exonuclease
VQHELLTPEDAEHFFQPNLRHLHDPFLMKGMDIAVERIQCAIDEEEKILLYGDYDVDGITSVSLMYTFLGRRYGNLDFYIPDRYKEGYGISRAGIDYAIENDVRLIIAMDCGIKAVEQVTYAREKGIDVVICDHHLPGDVLPPAEAILDPRQHDCNYPYKELSGCGITFKLIQAFEQQHNIPIEELNSLLDLVVISIASDIVPLTGENRILAYHGLRQLNHTHRPGLLALIDQSNLRRPFNIRDIVFGLAPIINAAGRLADAELAVRLILARNRQVAHNYADILEECNKTRRKYDQETAEEAEALITANPSLTQRKSLVLYQPHWHKGVIGIVASRLAERHHKPTIILTDSDEHIVGSARSVSEFDIYNAIAESEPMLINYGGHKYAAGMTIAVGELDNFIQHIEQYVSGHIQPDQQQPELGITAEVDFRQFTSGFRKILRKMAPFGPGNPHPVFLTRNVVDSGFSKSLNGTHLKLAVRQENSRIMNGIAFGQAELLEKVRKRIPMDICYSLQESGGSGRRHLQMVVKDIRFVEKETSMPRPSPSN